VLDSSKVNHDKKKLFPGYKEGRSDKKEVFKNFNDFLGLISKLPKLRIIRNIELEADDVIAHKALTWCNEEEVIIFSSDKDFAQMVSLSKNIYWATNYKEGKFLKLSDSEILDKFTVTKKSGDGKNIKIRYTENIKEIIKWRTFLGDTSDKIPPAIRGLRKEKIREILNVWEESYLDENLLGEIITRLDDTGLRMKLAENFTDIIRNYNLMNLNSDNFKLKKFTKRITVNISNEACESLTRKYNLSRYREFLLLKGYI
jgi:5'-3' exonuclease